MRCRPQQAFLPRPMPCHAMSTAVLEGGVIPDVVASAQKKTRRSKNKRHRHMTTFPQAETACWSESYYSAVTRKRKEKNRIEMAMSQCGGGGHPRARANEMELQRPAVTADYEFDSRERCLFAPQLQSRPFFAIFTADQLSQHRHDSASASSCRHACQFPAPCLQRPPLLALRPTSLPHYSRLLST